MIERANGQHSRGVVYVPCLAIRRELRKGTLAAKLKNALMRENQASGLAAAVLLVLDSNRPTKVIYKKWGFEDTGDEMPYGEEDTLLLYKYDSERFRPGSGGSGRA
jgi:ribosomal protein S18 acetylase RimI-like enzyme